MSVSKVQKFQTNDIIAQNYMHSTFVKNFDIGLSFMLAYISNSFCGFFLICFRERCGFLVP